ncbi:MAG: glycoside hydrolase family 15 protein [Verrucomicrobiota bacterium]
MNEPLIQGIAGTAFGAPGMEPRWTSSSKDGIGTAYNTASRLWFTLSHGIVNEIYYPCIDQPNTRDVQLLLTDGESFVHEERRNLETKLSYPAKGALAYQIVNRDPGGRYEIRKTVISDPYLPVLLMDHELVIHDPALRGKLRLYLLIAPHLKGKGCGNSADIIDLCGSLVLHASRESVHLACGVSPPFVRASAGYVGASDGYQDITRHLAMEWMFRNAPDGNVALTGEIRPGEDGRFLIAIGFGGSLSSAVTPMAQSLVRPFRESFTRFVNQWSRLRHRDDENDAFVCHSGDQGSMYRLSRCILQAHEDKLYQGGMIASMSIPWGEAKGDEDLGGYHLVWPRDLLHSTSVLLVSGQIELPLRALVYLTCIQRDDGSMPQNCWIDGTSYWSGQQLDETAAPVVLARRLHQAGGLQGFDPWVMVTRAVGCLMLNGPSTGQERWEENSGYSPSTLAGVLAAVISAAAFAGERGESAVHELLLAYADWLRANLEAWTCTRKGTLDPTIPRHFVRIVPAAADRSGPAGDPADLTIEIANGGGTHRASDILDGGFLNLVRYGFLAPDDPLVTDSLKLIDRELKVDFEEGPCWRRYPFDGYGSHTDGSAFDGSGYGGCWPLLTGERGHYELAAGRDALPYLLAMENFANDGGMFPEQIWPLDDAGPMKRGQPAGSAMPLCWAHAEYVSLVHSRHVGYPVDRIPEAWQRYVANPAGKCGTAFWSLAHRTREIPAGTRLVVLLDKPTRLRWRTAGSTGWREIETTPVFTRLHIAKFGVQTSMLEFQLDDEPTVWSMGIS